MNSENTQHARSAQRRRKAAGTGEHAAGDVSTDRTGVPAESGGVHPALTTTLPDGDAEIVGRLREASNQTFLLRIAPPGLPTTSAAGIASGSQRTRQSLRPPPGVVQGVYKPLRGERSLWDFPSHTLAYREVAAYQISRIGGFDVVPVTAMIDGPFGPGSLQIWVESDSRQVDQLIDLVPTAAVPQTGWFDVMQGFSVDDRPVSLIHSDDARLRLMALLDVLINNADRKGGHILVSGGRVFGVDHGICFHTEDKLRTLLWGWAGQRLTDPELARVQTVEDQAIEVLDPLLDAEEIEALLQRCEQLRYLGRFPHPAGAWRDIPWPPF